MRNRDEKIELLRSMPPFAGATARELRDLAAAGDIMSAHAGAVICRADGRALETYLVLEGSVDVVVAGRVVATLERGDFVGELGVIDGEPRSADVVAATDVALLTISARALRSLIDTNSALRLALLRQIAGRVRRMDLAPAS